jgi:prepilin-type N-terminal cleavage/methylation domain-containing protein
MIRHNQSRRRAFSLVEVIVTMTILAILMAISAPSVIQSVEQSHADLAGAGLRMIHTSQRFYWLENRTYATNLQALIDDGLIDENLTGTKTRYEYSITAASDSSFQAQVRRRLFDKLGAPIFDGAWQGTFLIDETGVMSGTVTGPTNSITGSAPVMSPAF